MKPWSLNKWPKAVGCLIFFSLVSPSGVSAKPLCSFEGSFDSQQKKFDIAFDLGDQRTASVKVAKVPEKGIVWTATFDHIKTPFCEFSTVLESVISERVTEGDDLTIYQGEIKSQYSLIDFKPAPELSSFIEIRDGKIYIQSLFWGGLQCQGAIGLLPPNDMDVNLKISEIRSNDFFRLIGFPEDNFHVEGFIDGNIRITGFWGNFFVQGRIESTDGVFLDLEYDNIVLNFSGVYPLLQISDSLVTKTNGLIFNMEGTFDLSKAKVTSFQEGMDNLKISPLVADSIGHSEWTIKRSQEDNASSSTEFKYRLQKNNAVDQPVRNEQDILGVERSIKF